MTLTAAPAYGEAPGFLGVVMLDTRFPRPPGDVGHPDAFGVPVRRRVVQGAWPGTIVQTAAGLRAAGVAPAFVHAVQVLEAEGARAITTSCGFLVLLQDELQAAARVPVVTSSLLQLPGLLARQPTVGVLTISAAALGAEHLLAAGVPVNRLADVVVQGVAPAGEFATAILGNRDAMDLERAGRDVVEAAMALKQREPLLQAVVLECTNMPPYRQAVEAATGLKTWALTDDESLLGPWR
ncbi:aspartate/glutamate racemase family protein [Polaromonas sp. YR568]|uniref:aspartate/glutamate racemase family protein n=1 Tax=Polaromonas sp. YR568 TaxID=1855301 RepID=UPI00398C0044